MDDVDILTEQDIQPVRRTTRSANFIAETGRAPNSFGAEEFRKGLVEALQEDSDLAALGIARGESPEEVHAKILGVSVHGPLLGDTVRFDVKIDLGPGRISRPRIQEIIDDNVKSEMKFV